MIIFRSIFYAYLSSFFVDLRRTYVLSFKSLYVCLILDKHPFLFA